MALRKCTSKVTGGENTRYQAPAGSILLDLPGLLAFHVSRLEWIKQESSAAAWCQCRIIASQQLKGGRALLLLVDGTVEKSTDEPPWLGAKPVWIAFTTTSEESRWLLPLWPDVKLAHSATAGLLRGSPKGACPADRVPAVGSEPGQWGRSYLHGCHLLMRGARWERRGPNPSGCVG